MRKNIFTLLLATLSVAAFSQETLQHFDPAEITPVAETYTDGDGYMTGHNAYGDEEYAEKYEIEGSGTVYGIAAIHTGTVGTSTFNASYRVYNVGSNGYPNTPLANKNIPYNDVPIDGSLFTVDFNNPVEVTQEFFVSFRLGDYSHGGAGTKKLAVTHAPEGTRPESDFDTFGRNVVRWHSHGATVWKDYRTEHFLQSPGYEDYKPAVYFSLFPIIELDAMSSVDFNNEASIGSVYPNPSSSGFFNVPVNCKSAGKSTFQLYDLTGKLLIENNVELKVGKNEYEFSTSGLRPGIYLLLVDMPQGKAAQRVIVK